MADLQWLPDLGLAGLLAATMVHAIRLERALGLFRRDRAGLDALLGSFDTNTRAAEAGMDRMRELAAGSGQQIARQAELGTALKDDLGFLLERGDRLADRMDALIRIARPFAATQPPPPGARTDPPPPAPAPPVPDPAAPPLPGADTGRMRSQAERDLLTALRTVR